MWGRVVLREVLGERMSVGGCCCVIGHTFCHPGGTFQLSVATKTSVVARWRVCPYRPSIHMHSCAQWHFSYWRYYQWSQARSFQCRCLNHTKLVLIWASLALSSNTIQMLLVSFKVGPYPTSLSVSSVSYQLWFSLRLMTQLDQVSCDQSAGMKAPVQTRQSPKTLKGCGEGRGMCQWQKIFTARKTVTTSLERQTICISGGDCKIDAVFIRVVIAKKYQSMQLFSFLVCAGIFPTPLGKLKNSVNPASSAQHKYKPVVPEELSLHCQSVRFQSSQRFMLKPRKKKKWNCFQNDWWRPAISVWYADRISWCIYIMEMCQDPLFCKKYNVTLPLRLCRTSRGRPALI